MTEQTRSKSRDRVLYWGLIIYAICMVAFPPAESSLDTIRIPSVTLLLLFLIQIIFPQFRFSKLANIIAVITIISFGILSNSSLLQ